MFLCPAATGQTGIDLDSFTRPREAFDPAEHHAVKPPERFQIGPIPGLTTAWHEAPFETMIPLGTVVQLRQRVPEGCALRWEGAALVAREGDMTIGQCPMSEPGLHEMRAVLTLPDGRRVTHLCRLDAVAIPAEFVQVGAIDVRPALPFTADEKSTNDDTMSYFFGRSIAAVRPLGGHRWRTSTDRWLVADAVAVPAGFTPLMEWRVPGQEPQLGPGASIVTRAAGTLAAEVGPLANAARAEIEAYAVTITSPAHGENIPEGVPVTFTAVTDPPGFEGEITWISSTKYGRASPVVGHGATFTVTFTDTWGPDMEDPNGEFRWVGARADSDARGLDEVTCRPNSAGAGCIGSCATFGEVCVPSKIVRSVSGSIRVTECACLPRASDGSAEGCHLVVGPGGAIGCAGTCPPGQVCVLETRSNIDGTICYRCVCVPVGTPMMCGPSADRQSCIGACPPGQCCIITKIRKGQDATMPLMVMECACVAWNGDPCRVIAPNRVPQCAGVCPMGQTCNLAQVPVMEPDGMGGMRPSGEIDFMCVCGPAVQAPVGGCPDKPRVNDWNGMMNRQKDNNCYNYGTNMQTNTFAQPGERCGRQRNLDLRDCQDVKNWATCDGLIFIGNPPAGQPAPMCPGDSCRVFLVVDPDGSPPGSLPWPPPRNRLHPDYHWYRENVMPVMGMPPMRSWSHKPGGGEATDKDSDGMAMDGMMGRPADPRTAGRERTALDPAALMEMPPRYVLKKYPGYRIACGFMCVPRGAMVRDIEDESVIDLGEPASTEVLSRALIFSGLDQDPERPLSLDEISTIRSMLAAAPQTDTPLPDGTLGYQGFMLNAGHSVPGGFPAFVRVHGGIIQVIDPPNDPANFIDSAGLENYLLTIAP